MIYWFLLFQIDELREQLAEYKKQQARRKQKVKSVSIIDWFWKQYCFNMSLAYETTIISPFQSFVDFSSKYPPRTQLFKANKRERERERERVNNFNDSSIS